jgi:hypothetical protein
LLDFAATAFKNVSPAAPPIGQGKFLAPIPVQFCPLTSVKKKQMAKIRALKFELKWIIYMMIFQAFARLIFWLGI